MPSSLERAILNTVRYFDLFDLSLTTTQLWRTLLAEPTGVGAGHGTYSLAEVTATLQQSAWLRQRLGMHWGYYYLRGRDVLVTQRLLSHRTAQEKWAILRRVVRLLVYVPGVRLLAGSGSLALNHTRPRSDLDLFVVVRRGRIWTVRLLLLAVTQLTGRRRTYWDREAPDKVCLNHYLADDALVIAPEIQSAYTAELYAHLVPLWGLPTYQQFEQANRGWLNRYLKYVPALPLPSVHAVRPVPALYAVTQWLDRLLAEPLWDGLEAAAEFIQRAAIARHTRPDRKGRVVLSATELAFHPDTKAPRLLEQLQQGLPLRL